jgi:hypothetical protein
MTWGAAVRDDFFCFKTSLLRARLGLHPCLGTKAVVRKYIGRVVGLEEPCAARGLRPLSPPHQEKLAEAIPLGFERIKRN